MTDSRNSGLSNRVRLTQSAYRTAVASAVAGVRNGYSDQDMADAWGVSAGTVNNAQNKRADLSGLPLLKLGERFGPEALDTVLALIGAKAVRDDAVLLDPGTVPTAMASVLPLLIDLFRDGDCSPSDVRALDRAGAIDSILKIADWLRQQRDTVRLEAVK